MTCDCSDKCNHNKMRFEVVIYFTSKQSHGLFEKNED